ncbi:MAG TPA: SigE family RNA polymerase sigma factor [Jatrophihabitantaceae bacterium]|jgi:RNA polymerase sigma-70 factor (sigma-E family)
MTVVAEIDHQRTRRAQFEAFVSAHGDRLLHTAYGLCGDWQHAEDLVQQALLKTASRWDRIAGNPLGYAYRCLARANIDRWRVLRHRPEVLTDPTALTDGSSPTAARSTAARSTADVDERLALLSALQALPARQRAIVVLRYLQDLSEADTADVLGISVGAVKSGASRGLARLRAGTSITSQEGDS